MILFVVCLSRLKLPDTLRQPDIGESPYQDITQYDPVHIEIKGEKNIKQYEYRRYGNDDNHGVPLFYPDGEQLMVDMVLVRLERTVSLADADQDDTHHIERRCR